MSSAYGIRLLIREHPERSIALATSTHALILKNSPPSGQANNRSGYSSGNASSSSLPGLGGGNGSGFTPRCMAEFGHIDAVDLEDYRSLSFREVQGTLGLITVNNDVFLCVVSSATRVAEVRPGETVQKINSVEFRMCARYMPNSQ